MQTCLSLVSRSASLSLSLSPLSYLFPPPFPSLPSSLSSSLSCLTPLLSYLFILPLPLSFLFSLALALNPWSGVPLSLWAGWVVGGRPSRLAVACLVGVVRVVLPVECCTPGPHLRVATSSILCLGAVVILATMGDRLLWFLIFVIPASGGRGRVGSVLALVKFNFPCLGFWLWFRRVFWGLGCLFSEWGSPGWPRRLGLPLAISSLA